MGSYEELTKNEVEVLHGAPVGTNPGYVSQGLEGGMTWGGIRTDIGRLS